MTTPGERVHFQMPAAPTLTLCERLYARHDAAGLAYLLEAVDDWRYVTCPDCLARREAPVRVHEALDEVANILRTSRAEPDEQPQQVNAESRASVGATARPGTFVWSLGWNDRRERQYVRVWEEFLGFFTPMPTWARWQLTMQVDVVGPEDVYLTGATVYGADAAGNVLGHITLREWAQG